MAKKLTVALLVVVLAVVTSALPYTTRKAEANSLLAPIMVGLTSGPFLATAAVFAGALLIYNNWDAITTTLTPMINRMNNPEFWGVPLAMRAAYESARAYFNRSAQKGYVDMAQMPAEVRQVLVAELDAIAKGNAAYMYSTTVPPYNVASGVFTNDDVIIYNLQRQGDTMWIEIPVTPIWSNQTSTATYSLAPQVVHMSGPDMGNYYFRVRTYSKNNRTLIQWSSTSWENPITGYSATYAAVTHGRSLNVNPTRQQFIDNGWPQDEIIMRLEWVALGTKHASSTGFNVAVDRWKYSSVQGTWQDLRQWPVETSTAVYKGPANAEDAFKNTGGYMIPGHGHALVKADLTTGPVTFEDYEGRTVPLDVNDQYLNDIDPTRPYEYPTSGTVGDAGFGLVTGVLTTIWASINNIWTYLTTGGLVTTITTALGKWLPLHWLANIPMFTPLLAFLAAIIYLMGKMMAFVVMIINIPPDDSLLTAEMKTGLNWARQVKLFPTANGGINVVEFAAGISNVLLLLLVFKATSRIWR